MHARQNANILHGRVGLNARLLAEAVKHPVNETVSAQKERHVSCVTTAASAKVFKLFFELVYKFNPLSRRANGGERL